MPSEHWIRLIESARVEPYGIVGFVPETPCEAMHDGPVEQGRYCYKCSKVHAPLDAKLDAEKRGEQFKQATALANQRAEIEKRADKHKRRNKKRHAA